MTAGSSRSSVPDADSNPFEAALDRGSPSLPSLPPRPVTPPAPLRDSRYGPPPPLRAPLPRSAPPPVTPPPVAPPPIAPPMAPQSQPDWAAPPEPIDAIDVPPRSRGRSRRRRPPQRPTIPWPQVLRRLEQILHGRILIGLFVFWALFWLIGGIAVVRLLKIDRPAPVAQLQLPGYSNGAPNAPAPTSQARDFQQGQPNGNNSASSSFGDLQPMVKPSRSGPPIGTFAGVVVICGLGAWFRLQHMNRK